MSPRVVAVVGAIAIAIGCGCAGSQLPPQHACAMPIAVSARPPVPSRRVPLRFVATEGGGRLPVANVWIGRDRAPLVIDTGANGHVLTEGLRWYLGLPSIDDPNRGRVTIVTDDGEYGVGTDVHDAAGRPAWTQRIRSVGLDLGLERMQTETPLMSANLEPLDAVGAFGFFSPQAIAEDDRPLVIDLAHHELRLAGARDGARPFERGTRLTPACKSPTGVPLFVADVLVDGLPARLIVDTGADRTELSAGGAIGAHFATRPHRAAMRARLGGTGQAVRIDGVEVTVGSHRARTSVMVAAYDHVSPCETVGALGNDVLSPCAIVVGRTRASLVCPSRGGT